MIDVLELRDESARSRSLKSIDSMNDEHYTKTSQHDSPKQRISHQFLP